METTGFLGDHQAVLLTVDEVAERLRIGRSLTYRLIERGEIPAIRLGRLLRVRHTDLERFIENSIESAPTWPH